MKILESVWLAAGLLIGVFLATIGGLGVLLRPVRTMDDVPGGWSDLAFSVFLLVVGSLIAWTFRRLLKQRGHDHRRIRNDES